MAEIQYKEEPVSRGNVSEGTLVTWPDLSNGDSGAAYKGTLWSDRSVQVSGDFGAGGCVEILGSLDGDNYVVVNDPEGLPVSVTSPSLVSLSESAVGVRPSVVEGDDNTSLTVNMLFVRK
jgi:hypothetical protein